MHTFNKGCTLCDLPALGSILYSTWLSASVQQNSMTSLPFQHSSRLCIFCVRAATSTALFGAPSIPNATRGAPQGPLLRHCAGRRTGRHTAPRAATGFACARPRSVPPDAMTARDLRSVVGCSRDLCRMHAFPSWIVDNQR